MEITSKSSFDSNVADPDLLPSDMRQDGQGLDEEKLKNRDSEESDSEEDTQSDDHEELQREVIK